LQSQNKIRLGNRAKYMTVMSASSNNDGEIGLD